MTFDELDRSPGLVYRNTALGALMRLRFRSNICEPAIVAIDADGHILSEQPHQTIGTDLPDGWEPADPFEATAIVRPDDWQDQPEQPCTEP